MKKKIKRFLRTLGFDIKKFNPDTNADALFFKMLKQFNINVIFDIGANEGNFGEFMRDVGYKGALVSFEPLSSAYSKLLSKSKNDDNWKVAPQMAIGDHDGNITINVSNNSESSSILNMLDAHTSAEASSVYIGSEEVRISKLDSLYKNYVDSGSRVFLKIDTQGYEDRVLKGAADLLKETMGIQLELSLIPLYKDQKLFDEMILQLKDLGFELWSVSPVFSDPHSGRQLQVDATFFRS